MIEKKNFFKVKCNIGKGNNLGGNLLCIESVTRSMLNLFVLYMRIEEEGFFCLFVGSWVLEGATYNFKEEDSLPIVE